jgi:hypothetical protein
MEFYATPGMDRDVLNAFLEDIKAADTAIKCDIAKNTNHVLKSEDVPSLYEIRRPGYPIGAANTSIDNDYFI